VSASTTKQIAWPTATEGRRVSKAMYDGITPIDELTCRTRQLLDDEGDLRDMSNPPSFEQLGILAAIAGHIEEQIACATIYRDDIRALLKAGKSALSLEPTEVA
jgi:hypothetical protein